MGAALAIKMVAYVGIAPIAAAFAERLPIRTMLLSLDVIRAGVALLWPFVSQIWEVYVLNLCVAISLSGLHADFSGHYS